VEGGELSIGAAYAVALGETMVAAIEAAFGRTDTLEMPANVRENLTTSSGCEGRVDKSGERVHEDRVIELEELVDKLQLAEPQQAGDADHDPGGLEMDPTIYTMGDPMIVREALFALAAIFNSEDWFNPANAFGIGGNLLAAALIGLIGILIAGINSQTMRVDYLLTAFVLFADRFGVKVNVNVEDVQTGNAAVVEPTSRQVSPTWRRWRARQPTN
jgi:hypothetical protein